MSLNLMQMGLDSQQAYLNATAPKPVPMVSELQSLEIEWEKFCASNNLPCNSASEVLAEFEDTLTAELREYIAGFIGRWDAAEERA